VGIGLDDEAIEEIPPAPADDGAPASSTARATISVGACRARPRAASAHTRNRARPFPD